MALYGPAIKKLIAVPADGRDPRITPRVVILHVAVSEQPSLFAYFNGPSGGVESHFYIRRDGTLEQYRDTGWQADANTDANMFAISIETQGLESGEWTPRQFDAIKALILWCHDTHGIPLVKCPTWDGAGVGYHTQFEGQWDKRGASCPGPDRIKQFNNVLVPWLGTSGTPKEWDDMATRDDVKAAVTEAITEYQVHDPEDPKGAFIGLVEFLRRKVARRSDVGFARDQILQSTDPTAIAAAIPADIAQQVLDALATRLTPKE